MITLKDKSTNRWLGQISYAQLKFLNEELAEEYKTNEEYVVNHANLEFLKLRGADAHLIGILEKAKGHLSELSFYWVKS